jgi:hypothetical protein
VGKMLQAMVTKTMDHVLSNLAFAIMVFASFDLWMSHGGVNTFALVINFLSDTKVPIHVTTMGFRFSE